VRPLSPDPASTSLHEVTLEGESGPCAHLVPRHSSPLEAAGRAVTGTYFSPGGKWKLAVRSFCSFVRTGEKAAAATVSLCMREKVP
jgi:hypothetical protein